MRLADDDRARVPFALVGVVLLVGSATVAATVGSPAPTATSAPTRAAEEATAVARTAIERAVSRAARRAARSPVVVPANTTAGRAINNSTPFRDYLRIRVYLAARRSLARATARVGDAEATVSLPNVSDTASLRAAKRRVRLRELDGERPRLAVTVRNVSVTVTRRGRVIERRRYAPTVAVETPVLALHRRTAAFERRLTRSPAEGGLAARVTAKLAALAWARGLAQYGGAPVANVVATRHLEVITNGALLDAQRRAFGRSDPAGRRAHDRAGLRAAADDLLAGSANAEWTEAVLGQVGGSVADTAIGIAGRAALDHTRTPLTVGVNRTADVAFMNTTDGALAAAIDGVYTAEARLRAESRVVERGTVGRTTPDGDGWRLARTATETTTGVEAVEAPPPQVSGEGHRLASFARAVTTRTRIIRTWRRGAQSVRTVAVRRTRRRVRIAVVGRHAVTPDAPDLAIDGAHSPGGPLDGTNFAGVRERAVRVLVERRGGADALARRVANGSVNTSGVTLDVPPPDGLREWVYRDLAGLRERVRALSVTVDRRTALTGSPTSRLLDATRHRRDDLLDAPATYPSVAAKARVAARAVYLDRVTARLEHRTRKERRTRDRLAAALARHNLSLSALLGALDPPPDEQGGDESPVAAVRGEPPYLTASAVGPRHTDAVGGAYHPLVARNRNLFATPHGDLGAAVAAELVPRDAGRAGLRAAGRALRAANATLRRRRNDTLRARRGRLRTATTGALDAVRERLRGALVRERGLHPAAADRAVAAGLRRWPTVHGRALAAANGSLARAVARAAPAGDSNGRDRLAVRLRVALGAAVHNAGVDGNLTGAVGDATTEIARAAVAGGVRATADSWVPVAVAPSLYGLPLLPVPGWWYATLNVWTATIRGRYARFAVRAPAGSPVPSRNVTYVRRTAAVTLDVDGDGRAERLGRNRPVSFAVETAVPVVVPPGTPGVGDGTRTETSPGWPEPGPR